MRVKAACSVFLRRVQSLRRGLPRSLPKRVAVPFSTGVALPTTLGRRCARDPMRG